MPDGKLNNLIGALALAFTVVWSNIPGEPRYWWVRLLVSLVTGVMAVIFVIGTLRSTAETSTRAAPVSPRPPSAKRTEPQTPVSQPSPSLTNWLFAFTAAAIFVWGANRIAHYMPSPDALFPQMGQLLPSWLSTVALITVLAALVMIVIMAVLKPANAPGSKRAHWVSVLLMTILAGEAAALVILPNQGPVAVQASSDGTSMSETVPGVLTANEIFVEAGEFQMGCSPNDNGCAADEKPLHVIKLNAFAIDKYEVTNARYATCVADEACTAPHKELAGAISAYYGNPSYADYPVVNIDWAQAEAFCAWEQKRLPTEAEWEKAARGSSDTRIFPWGDDAPSNAMANFGAMLGAPTEGGTYPIGASPYGVMDMSGNVLEWVNDLFGSGYYSQSPPTNPKGSMGGASRVLKGGSWSSPPEDVRLSFRGRNSATYYSDSIGFRCAH